MLRLDRLALTRRDGEARDPDIVEARLAELTVHTGSPATDRHIPDFFQWDPWDREEMRRKQLMYLGRYGRQSVAQWGDVDVEEICAYFDALGSIVGQEGKMGRTTEDM